ncbi:transmembrane protein 237-like, partial [Pomacea canaliculata]|uniref:transmembrane protein 237-like n=1 Tax=Pomacea canaliculata TaxID=400727 RepID=UPI000D73B645
KTGLPPISPRSESQNDQEQARPIRKKKKKPTESESSSQVAHIVDENPLPRRRRRTATPSGARDESSVEAKEDTEQGSPQKKTRKAKFKTTGDATNEGLDKSAPTDQEDLGSKASLIKDETPRKKGKKKKVVKKAHGKKEPAEFGDDFLAKDLQDIGDDVIQLETQKGDGDGTNKTAAITTSSVLQSQPTEKIFIETTRGFKGLTKTQLTKRIAESKQKKAVKPQTPAYTTMEFGLSTHRAFQTMCLYLHGLTAGIALWQIIFVFILRQFPDMDFVEHYRPMALPVHCVFYLLLALCVISSCDRYDIGNLSRDFVVEALTVQNGAIAIVIYLIALILSLSVVDVEDRIHLRYVEPSLWNYTKVSDWELQKFVGLNTARGIAAIIGWLVIVLTVQTDRLSKNLRAGDGEVLVEMEIRSASQA